MAASAKIYRFKLDSSIIEVLIDFAKLHKYDDRKTYKEHWEIWIKENEELIEKERKRLKSLNYDGNIIEKMFKSARYYFKNKKPLSEEEAHNKKMATKQRRKYISMSQEFIETIDMHIRENIYNRDYKPSVYYNDFIKSNKEIITTEIEHLSNSELTKEYIINKIKKTYKNRYYIMSKNQYKLNSVNNDIETTTSHEATSQEATSQEATL